MFVSNFPTLILTIIGVFAALILLGSYYVFVIKCCLNWQRSPETSHASRRRRRRRTPAHSSSASPEEPPPPHAAGLDESVINLIPTALYKKPKETIGVVHVCAVCLAEFEEDEETRVLINCSHFFHVECIDEWLRKNANCPLCRSPIGITMDHTDSAAPNPEINPEVVINVEIEDDNVAINESVASTGKYHCRGDESIELRREKRIDVRRIRRSFSVDSASAGDSWLSKEVLRLLQQNPHFDANSVAAADGFGSAGFVPGITLPKDLQRMLNDNASSC